MFDVVVPIYRIKPAWLKQCLQSIQDQTIDDWKCFIVDGTPLTWPNYEESMLVVDSFVSTDSRFSYSRQTGDGVSQARNQAIAMGDSPLIAFLDGDDYWYDEHLIEFQVAHENYEILEKCCTAEGVIYWTAADCPITLTFPKSGEEHTTLRLANHIVNYDNMSKSEQYHAIAMSPLMTSQVAIKRSRYDELEFGFDEELCLGEDQDLWLRIINNEHDAMQIPAVTGFHRAHAGQTTQHGDQLGGDDNTRDERLAASKERFRERHKFVWSGDGVIRDVE